ncbi:sensor histidine kinase [Gordonia sp. (in: high G+C Gram-positive bacteria)]|uniref:sensor histidine kinase n=1 Tax=Gordonia sp. (in: high G+C Gram-positive bacteria) TaxID=84139 RepID=UPI00169B32E7|nr:sensor histidine kinase [Gordonia sp. (in: high G+C Gram-positive bacteria)]NLG45267.1 sensor histidine kinase [Gordonia sp. (in: high G+C Gram-positive bacteria)]
MTAAPAPSSPWRSGRWLFGAVWLLFMAYPIIAVVTADTGRAVKAGALALIAVHVIVYLLLCVYAMFDDAGGAGCGARTNPRLVNLAIAVLVLIAIALVAVIHTDAFAVAPYLMAVVAFAAPWRSRYALGAIVVIIASVIVVPEIFGWEIDAGFLVVMVVVGISMGFSRLMLDGERERDRAEKQQQDLNARLAVVAERERVARDVHDILGHSLTVITVKSELAGRLVDLDPERAKSEIAELNALARDALSEVRTTVGALRTPELPSVVAAATSALTAAGIDARLPDPADGAGPDATLFAWVLREAVTNVVRHSGATRCEVTLTPEAIAVVDDGCGSPLLTFGNGLRGLAERVEAAGGRLTVDSGPDGTTVVATVEP